MEQHKHYKGTDCEQDHRIAQNAIADLFIPRRSQILLHGHRVHIANTTTIQIASRGMVNGVRVPPFIKWRKYEYTYRQSESFIGLAILEKRPMTAIMKDDEHTHHEASRWND